MPSLRSLLSVLTFSSLLQFAIADRKCYALSGTPLGDEYGPCDPNAKHSGCCGIHRAAGSVDICLSNGLCMGTHDEYMGTIWESGCTDPTGMDPSCPKICPDARDNFNNGIQVPAWNVQMCDYGRYCCRAEGDHSNCCNNPAAPQVQTTFIGAFQFETSTAGVSSTLAPTSTSSSSHPNTTSSSAVSSATSSTTPPASSTTEVLAEAASSTSPTPTAQTESTLCAAEKHKLSVVTGTLAAFFGAAIISLLAAMYFLFQKEKKQRKLKEHYEAQFATTNWAAYGSGMLSKTTVVEVDSTKSSLEKDGEVRYIGNQKNV